ncbi:MAG TPA: hypothetical protein VFM05_02395 [Candidatus Saccharimonadales bacterium]|nr:hypothetical protein [Candidatus Saccharimonadales bacterium]
MELVEQIIGDIANLIEISMFVYFVWHIKEFLFGDTWAFKRLVARVATYPCNPLV